MDKNTASFEDVDLRYMSRYLSIQPLNLCGISDVKFFVYFIAKLLQNYLHQHGSEFVTEGRLPTQSDALAAHQYTSQEMSIQLTIRIGC